MARKLKMTKACVAARKRYRAKKGARGGCPGKRGGGVLQTMATLFPRRLPIFSTVRRSTLEKRRRAATSKGGFFGRIGNARRRRAKVEARGGRIFHKYPKVSKTESRMLAQQQKARKKAWGLLPANKGGVLRKRGQSRRTRRSVFSTPGWRKQLAQTRGVGSRPGRRLGKPMAHSAASLGRVQ